MRELEASDDLARRFGQSGREQLTIGADSGMLSSTAVAAQLASQNVSA